MQSVRGGQGAPAARTHRKPIALDRTSCTSSSRYVATSSLGVPVHDEPRDAKVGAWLAAHAGLASEAAIQQLAFRAAKGSSVHSVTLPARSTIVAPDAPGGVTSPPTCSTAVTTAGPTPDPLQ